MLDLAGLRSVAVVKKTNWEAFVILAPSGPMVIRFTRASFREAYGNRFDNLVHPEDRKRVLDSINSQIKHSDYDTVEYRVTKADGRILWLFDKAQLVRDENGRSWFYVIVMDITSLRNTQQELKISEQRYRILTELSERIIFEHDLVTRCS